jgi:AraC-like DNA-binding protein
MFTDVFHIKTIQPYFVLKTDCFYQRIMASCGISHFFSYRIIRKDELEIPLVPDGCSNFLFSYGASEMKAYVLGLTLKRSGCRAEPGREYFGVRFQPGENPCFDELSVKGFVNETASLKDFPRMKPLCSRMEQAATFQDRVKTFLAEYARYFGADESKQRALFRQFYRLITKMNGVIKITELEKMTGYSDRYINYIFKEELGISAKQFCDIIKFQMIIDRMNSGNIQYLSKLAKDFQFYDQSHFIHDFERFTNETPTAYLQGVIAKNYRSHIVDL